MGLTPFCSQPPAASRWIVLFTSVLLHEREREVAGCRLFITNELCCFHSYWTELTMNEIELNNNTIVNLLYSWSCIHFIITLQHKHHYFHVYYSEAADLIKYVKRWINKCALTCQLVRLGDQLKPVNHIRLAYAILLAGLWKNSNWNVHLMLFSIDFTLGLLWQVLHTQRVHFIAVI